MTKLVAWAVLAGAVVGIVVFGAECWSVHRELAGVVFDAGYEPLPGVESATGYDSAFSTELSIAAARPSSWWNWSALPWWHYPLVGAGAGAVIAAPFAVAGVRFTRQR